MIPVKTGPGEALGVMWIDAPAKKRTRKRWHRAAGLCRIIGGMVVSNIPEKTSAIEALKELLRKWIPPEYVEVESSCRSTYYEFRSIVYGHGK